MTWHHEITLALTYFAAGALSVAMLSGLVLVPRAYRKGRAYTAEEVRVLELPTLLREEPWPQPQTRRDFDHLKDLPAQFGTLHEHRRRIRPPMRYVEITDMPAVTAHEVESWPLLWRCCWPVLLFVAHFWHTPVGVRLDRTAAALYRWLGRRERHWWTDYATGTHRLVAERTLAIEAAPQRTVEEILARSAASGEGVEFTARRLRPRPVIDGELVEVSS